MTIQIRNNRDPICDMEAPDFVDAECDELTL